METNIGKLQFEGYREALKTASENKSAKDLALIYVVLDEEVNRLKNSMYEFDAETLKKESQRDTLKNILFNKFLEEAGYIQEEEGKYKYKEKQL